MEKLRKSPGSAHAGLQRQKKIRQKEPKTSNLYFHPVFTIISLNLLYVCTKDMHSNYYMHVVWKVFVSTCN